MVLIRKAIGWIGLKLAGWNMPDKAPEDKKFIVISVPHTSNFDFLLGELGILKSGVKVHFLIKKEWFFFPMNLILKALGGIPVDRSNSAALVENMIIQFKRRKKFALLITPEGTRKRMKRWKHGFLFIASHAKVPVYLGSIDYNKKQLLLGKRFIPSGNEIDDMKAITDYYRQLSPQPRHPEKFSLEE